MDEILLIGGGGHCRSVIDVIEQEGYFSVAGIIDQSEKIDSHILGYAVIGNDDDLYELSSEYRYAIVTVGQIKSPSIRMQLFSSLKSFGFVLPAIISPRAYVSQHAAVGEGTIVMHDALVNAGVKVGKNCIINTKALIEHDCIVGDHCHLSTGAILNGTATVGDGCFIGSQATSRERVVIEENSFIKAGSLIL